MFPMLNSQSVSVPYHGVHLLNHSMFVWGLLGIELNSK